MKFKIKLSKRAKIVGIIILLVIVAGASIYKYKTIKSNEAFEERIYTEALTKYNNKDYTGAIELLLQSNRDDSLALLNECYDIEYNKAIKLKESGHYDTAIDIFSSISEYKDSEEQISLCSASIRDEYIEKVGVLVYKINKYKELAISVCTIINSEWGKVANTESDPTLALNSINETWKSTIQQLSIGRDGLEKQVESLEVLDGSELVYNKLIEIYETYVEINDQSISPSGTYSNYYNNVSMLSKEFDSLLEEIYVMEPDIKEVVQRERSEAGDAQ